MTPEQQILERLRTILAEHLGAKEDTITPATHLADDLGADSLDLVELIMAVEEEFHIDTDDADVEGIETVSDIISLIMDKQATSTESDDDTPPVAAPDSL